MISIENVRNNYVNVRKKLHRISKIFKILHTYTTCIIYFILPNCQPRIAMLARAKLLIEHKKILKHTQLRNSVIFKRYFIRKWERLIRLFFFFLAPDRYAEAFRNESSKWTTQFPKTVFL